MPNGLETDSNPKQIMKNIKTFSITYTMAGNGTSIALDNVPMSY